MAARESGSLTTHEDLVLDQLAHPPLGSRRLSASDQPVRAGITGSGESLLVLAWSAAELERERAAGVRLFSQLGLGEGVRVANALPGALATPGALLLGDVIQDLGGLDVPLGPVGDEASAKQAWTLVDLVEPAVFVLNPTSASFLFKAAPTAERSWWKGLIWLRTDTDATTPPSPPPAMGFSGWQRTWLAAPEATSFVGVSCAAQRFHVDIQLIAEAVDGQSGAKLDEGAPGTIVLTPLGLETARLRYVSAWRGKIPAGNCPCGTQGPTLLLANG
jgi:hypothetical protein